MRTPSTQSFYVSRNRKDGRVAIPTGVHEDTVVYNMCHESGRNHPEDRKHLVCSVSTFWERYLP